LYRQVWQGRPFTSDAFLWPAFIMSAVIAVWFSRMKQVTEIREDGVHISFVWLWPRRRIAWDQIRSVETCTYRPVKDRTGYGVRWLDGGIMYHARGKQGVRLVLASGERVLIGSGHAGELARAVAERTGLAH